MAARIVVAGQEMSDFHNHPKNADLMKRIGGGLFHWMAAAFIALIVAVVVVVVYSVVTSPITNCR